MRTSENINELAAALSKAQGQIVGAKKDSANPFFKSKYADLASCWDACRDQLSYNGLAVIQGVEHSQVGGIAITTLLTHASGQWIESIEVMHPKDDSPQAYGSAITYGRRYALAAMVGLAQVDDDAEAAQGRQTNGKQPETRHDPAEALLAALTPTEAKQVDGQVAEMRKLLGLDLQDEDKCLKVVDKHDALNALSQSLYTAAAKRLEAKEMRYWKELVHMAHDKERAEPRTNGRF